MERGAGWTIAHQNSLGKIVNMKKLILLLIFLIMAGMATMAETIGMAGKFTLSSDTIKDGAMLASEQVFNGFGCTGGNISPDLAWSNPPDNTKSYALIVHDPDAPVENGWYHWVVINIPVAKTSLAKGEKIAAPALECRTSFGKSGYGGACPPKGHGKHRYIFTIYALDTAQIAPKQEPTEIEKLIAPHILDKASIMAYYDRT